ncbi:MAG: SCP2 sterol-binding domain-containing protein [Candidatus Thermoplasmatota archaeon]|jgi:putative sterol carrier protein|nr:SCP2 sterol-binding domain-containing protein [Candidatus Thermoplasmatota archaeon]MCL5794056.1 SCP2 sterol-binding domain-containing protein [Candidatus Thermoplasmatota archaeon]
MPAKEILEKTIKSAMSSSSTMSELKGMEKTFQFKTSEGENFYVKIAGGNVEVQNGLAEKATTTISGSDQTLSDLLTGKLDPVKAFMSGQIKVSGDVFAAQKITSIMKKAGA